MMKKSRKILFESIEHHIMSPKITKNLMKNPSHGFHKINNPISPKYLILHVVSMLDHKIQIVIEKRLSSISLILETPYFQW